MVANPCHSNNGDSEIRVNEPVTGVTKKLHMHLERYCSHSQLELTIVEVQSDRMSGKDFRTDRNFSQSEPWQDD